MSIMDNEKEVQLQVIRDATEKLQTTVQLSAFDFLNAIKDLYFIQQPPQMILSHELGNSIGLVLFNLLKDVDQKYQRDLATEFMTGLLNNSAFILSKMLSNEAVIFSATDAAAIAAAEKLSDAEVVEVEISKISKTVH